jgi:hypothetical protein
MTDSEQPKNDYLIPKIIGGIVAITLLIIALAPSSPNKSATSTKSTVSHATERMPEGHTYKYHETDGQKFAWIEKGREAIAQRLKDPDSAKFRGVYFMKRGEYPPLVCGEVNSKNSLGGYAGFQRFITATTPDLTFIESDMKKADFLTVWNKLCAE